MFTFARRHVLTKPVLRAGGALLGTGLIGTHTTACQAQEYTPATHAVRAVPLPPHAPPVHHTRRTDMDNMIVFPGSAGQELAGDIARQLELPLGRIETARFADGECKIRVHEDVRGKDVYIVQPTCPPDVNGNLVELLLTVSALKRASVSSVTVVMPYYGYARQDRKLGARVPISSADVALLLETVGVDRALCVDLHCGQIQGFFGPRVPVDNLDGAVLGVHYFANKRLTKPVIVSPDAGGVARATQFQKRLQDAHPDAKVGFAMLSKTRPRAGEVGTMQLVGDVAGCDVIIVDDMVDTAGTLCKAVDELHAHGARSVSAMISHAVLSGPALVRVKASPLKELVVLNTIPQHAGGHPKIVPLDVSGLLASAMRRIQLQQSVSDLFKTPDTTKPACQAPAGPDDGGFARFQEAAAELSKEVEVCLSH